MILQRQRPNLYSTICYLLYTLQNAGRGYYETLPQYHGFLSTFVPSSWTCSFHKASCYQSKTYSDLLGQLDSLRVIANTPDTKKRGYVRQEQAGKLWVRERVLELLDEGSLGEVGSVAGTVQWRSFRLKFRSMATTSDHI